MRRKECGRKTRNRALAMLLACAVAAALLSGCADRAQETAADAAAQAEGSAPGTETAPGTEDGRDSGEDLTPATGPSLARGSFSPSAEQAVPAAKKETVTVKADASGRPYETTAEVELSRPEGEQDMSGSGRLLRDRTSLYGITNKEGDEEFYRADDGTILWQDGGQTIRYEGKSGEELPVDVRVRYYLDGEEKKPAEMEGVSGEIRIRFDYHNRTRVQTEADGHSYETVVPFAVMSAVVLDGDVFSDITAENAKVAELGGESAVIGYAFPGVAEALDLAHCEVTEEIDIPSYVEVRAQARDFTLPFTATVITPGLFGDLEDTDLEDAEDLTEDMGEFRDASGELVSAAAELYDGAGTFGGYLKKYVRAASKISDGVDAMKQGLTALDENGRQLREGASGLSAALSALDGQLSAIDLSALDPENEENAERTKAIAAAAAALAADAQALAETHLPALQARIGELEAFTASAEAYRQAVEEGIGQTEQALEELEAFDGNAFENGLTEKAREQAGAAARKAAGEVSSQRAEAGAGELSDEEIRKIEEAVRASVDLGGSTSSLRELHETTARKIRGALDTETIRSFTVPDTDTGLTDILTGTYSCLGDMEQQLLALQEFAGNMGQTAGQLQQLQASLGALQSAVRQLSDGSDALSEGLSAYGDGVSALASGASQLRSGMREFSKAGSSLAGGYGAITEGLKAFSEGLDEFDREGVQKLAGLAGEDLAEVLRRLKAIRSADRAYRSFSGIFPEQEGSVRFILETDSIGE